MSRKHFVIPDTQVKPGVNTDHLEWAGHYAVAKKPDVIVMIGDFADMSSLSSYDVGKKEFEGRKYTDDIQSARAAMIRFIGPITDEVKRTSQNHRKRWNPKLVLTLGNHENRIDRAISKDRKLEGLISTNDLGYSGFGWDVVPFLQPIVIDGVAYCHYFCSGIMGNPVTTASALLAKKHQSAVMGHVQSRQIAYGYRADGTQITGLFSGAFYSHDEPYLNPQGNKHWRGVWMLHQVENGSFDEMPVSIDYLKRKYS